MKKQLLCGAAIRDITPPEEIIHGLRGLMGCKYGGVHDNLKVRAIAFDNGETRAVIVQPDTDKDQSPVRELKYISERWNVPEENILYFGIHTHSAPMHTGRHEMREDGMSEEELKEVLDCTHKYEELFFERMHEAIDEAFSNLKPCKIGVGKAQNYTNVRRVEDLKFYGADGSLDHVFSTQGSDPGAKVSHEMFVMRINDLEDNPIAFLINFPMHCVVMFLNSLAPDGTNLISGDVAGNVSQALERKFPGAVAAWSSGAAGDMNPLPSTFAAYVDPDTNEIGHMHLANLEVLNYIVANQFMSIMEAMNNIPYYSAKADIAGALEYSKTPLFKRIIGENGRPVGITDEIDEKTFDVRMQTLRIGDVLLIGIGGELFNSFAEELKALSPLRNTAVINHNLSLISLVGYIHDDDAIARQYALFPGMGTNIVPGYLSASLREHFTNMLEKI